MTEPFEHQGEALRWLLENVAVAKQHLIAAVTEAATSVWSQPPPETIIRFAHHLGDLPSVEWYDQHGGHDVRVSVGLQIIGPTGMALKPKTMLVCVVGSGRPRRSDPGGPASWTALFDRLYAASVVAVDQTFRTLAPQVVPGSLAYWTAAFPKLLYASTGTRERSASVYLEAANLDGSVWADVSIVENEAERSRERVTLKPIGRCLWATREAVQDDFYARFKQYSPDQWAQFVGDL